MRDRGILRARIFLGSVALLAAVITWGTTLMMSPHGDTTAVSGVEHVRTTVAMFIRNSAIGTLVLSGLAAWLLFPARRPRRPWRDWAVIAAIALMVLTSLYQLFWLRSALD